MSGRIDLAWLDVHRRAQVIADEIALSEDMPLVYGVPRGGIPVAVLVFGVLQSGGLRPVLVDKPESATVFVDDIVDSGLTKQRYANQYPNTPFFALYTRKDKPNGEWISFPWERMQDEQGPEDAVKRLIEYIGDDPSRDGLLETPKRVVRSFAELYSGYQADPSQVVKCFDSDIDEMVMLSGIEFYSTCEHHMLPFTGTAHIAYIPKGRVIGVSKLARVLEVYTRRLQIQERICQQVTQFLMEELEPLGVGCVLEAKHLCMTCRGVNKQHSTMITSSLEGVFRRQEVRQEFLNSIR